jgi:hypothetical protein
VVRAIAPGREIYSKNTLPLLYLRAVGVGYLVNWELRLYGCEQCARFSGDVTPLPHPPPGSSLR